MLKLQPFESWCKDFYLLPSNWRVFYLLQFSCCPIIIFSTFLMRIGVKEEPVLKLLWNYKGLWGASGTELEDSGSWISGPLKRGNNAYVVDTYTVVDSAKVAPWKGNPAHYKHCNKNHRGNLTLHSPEWPGTAGASAEQRKPGSVCIAAMRKNIEQWSSFGKSFAA